MRLRDRRGSVLVHVLVTAVVVMILAAGIARIVLMRYVAEHRFEDSGGNRRLAEAAVAQVSAAWATAGVCSAVTGFSGSGSAGTCACTLTGTGVNAGVTLVASSGAGGCQLNITAGTNN